MRQKWKERREYLELNKLVQGPLTDRPVKMVDRLGSTLRFLYKLINFFGLAYFGKKFARNIQVHYWDQVLKDLPPSFEGLNILHLSDLHLDERPEINSILKKLEIEKEIDLIVVTGDFFSYAHQKIEGHNLRMLEDLSQWMNSLNPTYGVIGVLGNHDSFNLVEPFEKMGHRMLINEHWDLQKHNETICLFGTDDPHYFFSWDQVENFKAVKDKFSIALVHTPELYDVAADNEINLYLCGHTHGGQIALPGGIPILKQTSRGSRSLLRGNWKFKGMAGFTSCGVGTVSMPIRYFAIPEVVVHTLRGG